MLYVTRISMVSAAFLIAAFCLVPSPAGAGELPVNPRALMAQAKKAATEGNTVRAVQLYRDVVRDYPANVDALTALAVVEEQVGNKRSAQKLWEKALAVNPERLDAYIHLGYLNMNAENFAAAVDYFQRCAQKSRPGDPYDLQAQQGLDKIMARSAFFRGQIIEARAKKLQEKLDADAKRRNIALLERQVNLYQAMIAQGRALFNQKQYKEAIDSLDLALQFMPGDQEAAQLRQAADLALHREANNALTDTAITNLLSSGNP